MKQDTLADLLQLAVPKPGYIAASGGAAALALALHCLMTRDGFTVEGATAGLGQKRPSSYTPPADWNGKFQDEWVFTYTKDGKANKFVLHCSLQAASNRMYIHCSELGNLGNVHVLGLLVSVCAGALVHGQSHCRSTTAGWWQVRSCACWDCC